MDGVVHVEHSPEVMLSGDASPERRPRAAMRSSTPEPTAREMASAHRAALNALGAAQSSVRSGGMLPYFMAYGMPAQSLQSWTAQSEGGRLRLTHALQSPPLGADVGCTLLVLCATLGIVLSRGLLSRLDASGQPWLFWETVALAREVQTLLSFPFLIFMLPMALCAGRGLQLRTSPPATERQRICDSRSLSRAPPCDRPVLTQVHPTGYDKRGLLCRALSRTQIRLVREEERKRCAGKRASVLPVLDAELDELGSASSGGALNQDRVWTELL